MSRRPDNPHRQKVSYGDAPELWLQCSTCHLHLRSPGDSIRLTPHLGEDGVTRCTAESFTLTPDLSDEMKRRAAVEVARRVKKFELRYPPKSGIKRDRGKTTSRWEGVRAVKARPSRGSAGLPGLGKR